MSVMVAPRTSLSQRFAPPPKPVMDGRWRLAQFTRYDAEFLVREGIIPEDASIELLDGLIVLADRSGQGEDPLRVGKSHRIVVEKLSDLRTQINSTTRHVETQQPLVCSETHVPQPDFMILRGALSDYEDLPTSEDAYCVVEVADSSYERDAGEKLTAYARAGVQQYIIVNLRINTAEVYTQPDQPTGVFAEHQTVSQSQILRLRTGAAEWFDVALSELLT